MAPALTRPRRLWRAAIVLAVLLALLAGSLPGAGARQDWPRPRFFGVIGSAAAGDPLRGLPVGWQQLPFEWAAFQPDGPADFEDDAFDRRMLDAAKRAGREVVGLITDAPPWASDSGAASAVPAGLDLPADDPGNVWAAFVGRLAATYEPRGVHHWVIYDQPDIRPGEGPVSFAGEVEDYARLVQTAFLAARAADPQAVIHLAALNRWGDVAAGREPYLARLLRLLQADENAADHGAYFDVVTVQAFNETQAVADAITQARDILDAAGLADKPLWLITNASPTLDPAFNLIDPVLQITLQQQADFIVQTAALALALGVERMGIDRLEDRPDDAAPWGLVRADGSGRPAYSAAQRVLDLFAPTRSATRYTNDYAELILLEQPERVLYVMWARGTTPVQFQITSAEAGETGTLYHPWSTAPTIRSRAVIYPAAFVVDVPPAALDANSFLTVAGSPRTLVLEAGDDVFFRVAYAVVNGSTLRLK